MKSTREIRSLTGLRGVAALFVVVFHADIVDHRFGYLNEFVQHGYLSVDLFFVLSGYVMALTYRSLFAIRFTWTAYADFLARRLARIYPLYLISSVFAACLLVVTFDPSATITVPVVLANAAMVQSWGFGPSLNGPTWSLSAEWAAYLLFPLVAAATLFSRWWIAAAACLAAVAVLVSLTWLPASLAHPIGPAGPLNVWYGATAAPVARCVPEFLLGTLAWRLSSVARLARIAASPWPSTGIAIVMAVLMLRPGADVIIVCLMPLLVFCLAHTRSGLSRLLAGRTLHWLGVVSYSLYLVHFPLVQVATSARPYFAGVPHSWSLLPLSAIVVSLGLAALTYQWVERPGKRLVMRWLAQPAVSARNYV